jgi:hypothetical protein
MVMAASGTDPLGGEVFIAVLVIAALLLLVGYVCGYQDGRPNVRTKARMEALERTERIHQQTYAALAAMADEVARGKTGK